MKLWSIESHFIVKKKYYFSPLIRNFEIESYYKLFSAEIGQNQMNFQLCQ